MGLAPGRARVCTERGHDAVAAVGALSHRFSDVCVEPANAVPEEVTLDDQSRLGRAAPAVPAGSSFLTYPAGSISRLTIQACLPTCRPLVNPYCSKSSAVALNRNRP